MRNRLYQIGAVLLLAIPLILLLRGFARDVVLMELLRFGWGVRVLFESVPQVVIWAVFLVAILVIALRSLVRWRVHDVPQSKSEITRPGQVYRMSQRIRRSPDGEYFRWRLAHALRALVLEVLAHRDRTTAREVRWRLESGELDVPPEVQTCLRVGLSPRLVQSMSLCARLKRLLPSRAHDRPLDPELEQVVQFLESELQIGPRLEVGPNPEVPHDHRSYGHSHPG